MSKLTEALYPANHPVALAVLPLKTEAIARAEKDALATVERCRKTLAENSNRLDIVAPYPDSRKFGYQTPAYYQADAKYRLFTRLVKHRDSCHRVGDPQYVDINSEMVDRFVISAKDDAGVAYDLFIAKLIGKIGECQTAELSGNHVWGYSFLKVVKKGFPKATVETWKTQQIMNISKLGKLFNQWPSRKMK